MLAADLSSEQRKKLFEENLNLNDSNARRTILNKFYNKQNNKYKYDVVFNMSKLPEPS